MNSFQWPTARQKKRHKRHGEVFGFLSWPKADWGQCGLARWGLFGTIKDFRRSVFESCAYLGRMATADEIAESILVVASSKMSYVNGQLIVVDGGKSSW